MNKLILLLIIITCNPQYIFSNDTVHTVASEELWFQLNSGNKEIIKNYLQKGGNINITDNVGNNLLMLAAINADVDIVKFLIKKGINVNHKNKLGQNAFISAIMSFNNNIETMKILIENGIDTNILFTFYSSDNWNTLLIAADTGIIDIIDYLLNMNFDINYKNQKNNIFVEEI
ncbi:MAG: ankyrin repeat domain-containing protein [Spirochaetes bacterium]|nr:ankyrin repeat domain-containing protein [Spirochaetota bacterium]